MCELSVTGVIRESFQKGRDQMVPITLLAVAVVLAFITGAVFSGIVVYCVCDHRQRHLEPRRKAKDTVNSRRGSMNSVTKLTGLFETQAKDGRPEAILTPLMHNGKTLIKAEQQPQHMDLVALPTPESTPMQLRRKPSRASREWERNQNLINACAKELASMGSPTVLIGTDLPLRASPGHIPSVVVLPLQQQHQHQQVYQHQHEYVEQPHRVDLPDDQAATLEYKTMKSPCHPGMVDGDVLPPRVPQREASLAVVPPAVPQMGKRLDVYCRGYPMGLKKQHNTNSSNSSHLSKKRSFSRTETPPPAPQRLDSMHVSSPSGLSRHSSMSSYGSLPRCNSRHLRPDVPPKPSQHALSGKVKCSDSGT